MSRYEHAFAWSGDFKAIVDLLSYQSFTESTISTILKNSHRSRVCSVQPHSPPPQRPSRAGSLRSAEAAKGTL